MKRLLCSLLAVVGAYVVSMAFDVMRQIVFTFWHMSITWAIICSITVGYVTFKSMKN